MIRRTAALATALLLLMHAGIPRAQQDEPADSEEAAAVERDSAAQSADSREPDSDTAAPARGGDPFDYESSEQISEDLSVSFPVDI